MAAITEIFNLGVEPGGWSIPVAAGSTLLQAALGAGLRLPSSCRNGTCRECRCRLLAGRARHLIEWPGLSADERREGWILPCVAEPLSDLVIEAPRAAYAG
ncbi:MAG: 2Fe-2S iron-sulfur cluster binding domain-containing protein [Burkholderiales bacterium]|nr:2Fe-2S iron-sulfur cluster binding domain-containing protein [Burkholderiales bacterium]MDE2454021.1 2Fe-2S iron-sulfur cluster binding domain-containing protein [Burkholderiales bacterium]